MEILNKINKAIKPYYSLLSMLLFFFILFISAYKFIISPSDLRVSVEEEEINYPSSIGDQYDVINHYVVNKDTLVTESLTIYNFLLKTSSYKKIVLKNTSNKTIRGVKFKHLNVDDLTAFSIKSDYFTNEEEQILKKNLVFDKLRSIIYLKSNVDLPSNSQIIVWLWGNFKNDLANESIVVSYDEGDGHFEQVYNIIGIKGYFVNHAFEFLAITVLIFTVVYYLGIKYALQK